MTWAQVSATSSETRRSRRSPAVGKSVLRDYVNATVGIDELSAATRKSPKSLMRMFGPDGNPQAPQPI